MTTSNRDIFSKIRDCAAPARIVLKNEFVTCFHDNDPDAPVHILIIPNKKFVTLADAEEDDVLYLGHMLLAAKQIAHKFGVSDSGYRLIMNINRDGGQAVKYLHLHLLGGVRLGRLLSLPPSSKRIMHQFREGGVPRCD